jgi:hypothetical protein
MNFAKPDSSLRLCVSFAFIGVYLRASAVPCSSPRELYPLARNVRTPPARLTRQPFAFASVIQGIAPAMFTESISPWACASVRTCRIPMESGLFAQKRVTPTALGAKRRGKRDRAATGMGSSNASVSRL